MCRECELNGLEAATRPRTRRSINESPFPTAPLRSLLVPLADSVDHSPEGGALGAGGVLAVPLGLRAGDDLLARGP